ncbi:response regulator [Variovorax sp. J22P168]|uniref:response regulator transcription factor n=1 Tax=Variovorax jilinensis TaxID=3053513 RepID=UPI002576FA73|nr:response regulator [Variovorax sp. J22P168]MDM0014467.1 response regulator [Variovorax sp. J22P168]
MANAAATLVIHVVDDDMSVRTGLARLMRSAGHPVQVFEGVEQFLERSGPAMHNGCVVLDISMPELSAPPMQHRLTQAAAGIPVIALSTRDDDETRRLARVFGARFFLRKPVDDQALLDAIEWVAGGARPPE